MLFSSGVLTVFFLSVAFTTGGQLLQKKASMKSVQKKDGISLSHTMFNIEFLLSTVMLGLGLLFWLMVLTKVELSVAYPLLSINYVVILLGAKFLFKESVPPHRWCGVAVILLGISILLRG